MSLCVKEKVEFPPLVNDLPTFSLGDPNRIIWYQYCIYVDSSSPSPSSSSSPSPTKSHESPLMVTYPVELCWDIEGQWRKFQDDYAINPLAAEKMDSRFIIGDPDKCSDGHCMIADLLSMHVTDSNTGSEYEIKRTGTLSGTLVGYGRIQFNGYYDSSKEEIFLYDTKTGYYPGVGSHDFKIGDTVAFESWWNKDYNDTCYYDITPRIDGSANDNIHKDMFAFNVRLEMKKTSTKENDLAIKIQTNPGLSLETCNPFRAEDFSGLIIHGLIIALDPVTNTGYIVCFPYKQKDKDNTQQLTLIFHVRFVQASLRLRLAVNICVEFVIGVNPVNSKFVAMDIKCSNKHSINQCNDPLIPITLKGTETKHHGRVIVEPVSIHRHGWIYNDDEPPHNMIILNRYSENGENQKYRINTHVAFNEKTIYDEYHVRDTYSIVAVDVRKTVKVDEETLNRYCSGGIDAKRFVIQRKLAVECNANIEFAIVESKERKHTDIHVIVEKAYGYLKSMFCSSGGALLFGVHSDGLIEGQKYMTKPKMNYIISGIKERLSHCTPSVPDHFYSVVFKELVDNDGYGVRNTYVVIVKASKGFIEPGHQPALDDYGGGIKSDDECLPQKKATKITTPSLNAKPIPPNNVNGLRILSKRVQIKLNEMMMVEEYILDPRWNTILTLASSTIYNAQKTTWILMRNLERELICANIAKTKVNIVPGKDDDDIVSEDDVE